MTHSRLQSDKQDRHDVIKSTIEWFGFIIVILIIMIILFSTVFRISSVYLIGGNLPSTKLTVVYLSNSRGKAVRGDYVIVNGTCSKVLAAGGENVSVDTNGLPMVDEIIYRSKSYTQEHYDDILGENYRVSDSFALVEVYSGDVHKVSAELIDAQEIDGNVTLVAHPFLCFGKSVDSIRKDVMHNAKG